MRTYPGVQIGVFKDSEEREQIKILDNMMRHVSAALAKSIFPGQLPAANPVPAPPNPGGGPTLPTPVRGDLLFSAGNNAWSRLSIGATSALLESNGQEPVWTLTPSLLLNYLYLPGKAAGQTLIQLGTENTLTIRALTHSSDNGTLITDTPFRITTIDGVGIFTFGSAGTLVINIPHSTYTSGNPTALTIRMDDATTPTSTGLFSINTRVSGVVNTPVFKVNYAGTTTIDMGSDVDAFVVDLVAAAANRTAVFTKNGSLQSFIDNNGAWNGPIVGTSYAATFTDSLFTIVDNGTPSRAFQFQASAISNSTTRTLTAPNANTTIAGLSVEDQTFTKRNIFASDASSGVGLIVQPTGDIKVMEVRQLELGTPGPIFGIYDESGSQIFLATSDATNGRMGVVDVGLWSSGAVGTGFAGRLTNSPLTAARAWTFPDFSGVPVLRTAAVDLTNQSSSIVATNLITAANVVTAVYIIAGYITCTTAGDAGDAVNVTIRWHDGTAAQSRTFLTTPLTPVNNKGSDVINIRTVKGQINTLAAAPTAGGTGYTVGDTLTITTGGTGGTCTVSTVAAGVVTAVALANRGTNYTAGAGKATTGGTGTGCTVNITAAGIPVTYETSLTSPGAGTPVHTLYLRVTTV